MCWRQLVYTVVTILAPVALAMVPRAGEAEPGFAERYQRNFNIYTPGPNQYHPDNPFNPVNRYMPDNPFTPVNQYDPDNPENPINRYRQTNPHNPANRYHPDNPLNPANRYNPQVPYQPLK